jgi:hypothetical protein
MGGDNGDSAASAAPATTPKSDSTMAVTAAGEAGVGGEDERTSTRSLGLLLVSSLLIACVLITRLTHGAQLIPGPTGSAEDAGEGGQVLGAAAEADTGAGAGEVVGAGAVVDQFEASTRHPRRSNHRPNKRDAAAAKAAKAAAKAAAKVAAKAAAEGAVAIPAAVGGGAIELGAVTLAQKSDLAMGVPINSVTESDTEVTPVSASGASGAAARGWGWGWGWGRATTMEAFEKEAQMPVNPSNAPLVDVPMARRGGF